MKKYDVIIIGGGPSAIISGITGIKQSKDKTFLMIKEDEKGLVPCGIPYIFHDLGDVSKNEMGPKGFINAGGEVLIDHVNIVDTKNKKIGTDKGKAYEYEKLVFATGSVPIEPKFIEGCGLKGVEYIRKRYDYIKDLKAKTDKAKKIIIIGGGFIGCEFADQLVKFKDKEISIVEMQEHCLFQAFSPDIAQQADEALKHAGVKVYTNSKVKKVINKNGRAIGVELDNGSIFDADLIICSIGSIPNTKLAKEAGININKNGAISVDNYLRTSEKDVFAAGDCAGTIGFITGRTDNVMLASTATAEARVLGYNLFNIKLLRKFGGVLSVFSTELNGKAFASTGAIEQSAKQANVSYVVGEFQSVDRHPAAIKDSSKLYVRLIVSPGDGSIIGGELIGGKSIGEMINIISLAIQKHVTVYELVSFQVGTHPLLTTSPTQYVLIKAAEHAMENIETRRH